MPISYKNKIYTTLGTPTELSGNVVSTTDSAGVPAKDYTVKGKTIVWNQLLDKSKYPATTTINGVTFTNNGDGTITVNGTATANADFKLADNTYKILANHKCLITGGINGDAMVRFSGDPTGLWEDTGVGVITNQTVDTTAYNFSIRINSGTTVSNLIFKPQLFDLTQMFGAGNEPATPSEFRAMFPDDYYSYNAGELKSITGYDKKSMMLKRGLLLNKDMFAGNSTKRNGVDFTYNDGSITVNGTATAQAEYMLFPSSLSHTITVKGNTKYLFLSHPSLQNSTYYWVFGGTNDSVFTYNEIYAPGKIVSRSADKTGSCYFILRVLGGKTVNNEITTPQLFNLTAIFGLGNEPSTVEEFLSYFPPDQYNYTTGEKIGTTGNLQLQSSLPQRFQLSDKKNYFTNTNNGVTFTNNGDGTMTLNGTATAATWRTLQVGMYFIPIGHKVMLSGTPFKNNWKCLLYDGSDSTYGTDTSGTGVIYTQRYGYSMPYFYVAKDYVCNNLVFKPQLFDLTDMFGFGNEPTTTAEFWQRFPDALYETDKDAYRAVNIPSSKYFPGGMKSAGSVYDEINFLSQKALKRIGAVDLGSLNWTRFHRVDDDTYAFVSYGFVDNYGGKNGLVNTLPNLICTIYETDISRNGLPLDNHISMGSGAYLNKALVIKDDSYTDAAAFKAAMSGVMLYYELATPVETEITPPLQALSTFNGFTSFSAPNSLTQNGPLSVTYYAEGGANPESGWLTSYKRKLYMGRTIEWNQLFTNSVTSSDGVTILNNQDGTMTLNGTANRTYINFTPLSNAMNQVHKYLLCLKILNNPDNVSFYYGWLNRYKMNTATISNGESCVICNQTESLTQGGTSTGLAGFAAGTVFNNVKVAVMVMDLTQMFGAGNEPATPEEFWSYFDHKLYPYNPGETQPLFKISRKSLWAVAPKHYTARWDKVHAAMVRLNDAASFPTNITNFAHRGSVNANYNNPFDNIYPWSGIKLCNIDINAYRNLSHGESITKCVTAWEGDANFSYNDANGVWRYRPEFWGKSWEDDTYRYFDVADNKVYDSSYVYYPEAIVGRWHGRAVTLTVGGRNQTCLIPSVGMPAKRIAVRNLQIYAKRYGATIDSIFSIDADVLLCIVEFATMNTQNAIGNGVTSMYRQSSDLIAEDATNSNVVKVLASAASASCIPGAIFDIGTSNGGAQVGSYYIVSAQPNAGNAQYLDVTLNEAVTVTTANYWSVHGIINVADEEIGSKSGYIGTNGKCNSYYRGLVLFGNMWLYTLGAYENKEDQHIWIANSDEEADKYVALNTSVHYDTGLVLPSTSGYTKKLGMLSRSGLLSIPVFCTETGGDSSNPTGDYFYNGVYTHNTMLMRGGTANTGSYGGAFYGNWSDVASASQWYYAARPRLKNP